MCIPIENMQSLGPKTAAKLAEVGIRNSSDLRAIGAVAAFRKLRFRFGREVTVLALYALESAIRDCHWRAIDEATKSRLRREAGLD